MDERMVARFWAKVDRSAGPDGCWIWTASKVDGYGYFKATNVVRAHRFLWELVHGSIPKGDRRGTHCLCHRCDNRACVNPAHLFAGTQSDNMADMAAKGRGARGELNGNAKLTAAQVLEIRSLRMPQREIARRFGVSQRLVGFIVRGEKWAHVG